jgi:uncharacterized protein YndB with AHSA1/START domain
MGIDPESDLILTKEINAPRELFYACWSIPAHTFTRCPNRSG